MNSTVLPAATPGDADLLRVNALDLGTATGEASSVASPAVIPGELSTPRVTAIVFSARLSAGPTVNRAIIQVDDDNDWGNDATSDDYLWYTDAAAPVFLPDIEAALRSADIPYRGKALGTNTTYYWRLKFMDKAAGDPSAGWAVGAFSVSSAVVVDGTVSQDGNGKSVRIDGPNTWAMKIAAHDLAPVSVRVWLRYSSDYGVGAKPTITISGMGITPVVKTMDVDQAQGGAGAEQWQLFTFTVTPSNGGDPGVLTVTINTAGCAADGNTWVDNMLAGQ